MPFPEYDLLMKFAIVGDTGVGKSCLISHYCDDFFPLVSSATIGVDFRVKMIEMDNKVHQMIDY